MTDRWRIWVAAMGLIATGCAPMPEETSPPTDSTTRPAAAVTVATTVAATIALTAQSSMSIQIPRAVAVNLGTNGTDPPTVAWISDDDLTVATLDLIAGSLSASVTVNGDVQPFAHHLERPAVAVRVTGDIEVSFTAPEGSGGSVYWTLIDQSGPSEPIPISGEPAAETNLVHSTVSPDGDTALAWLENSTLSVAIEQDGHLTETEGVDQLTCDCCNPVPIFAGDDLVVAYRDLERTDNGTVRNVTAIASHDRGATYGPVVAVADEDWYIDGCPFTGPSGVSLSGRVVVAWMDARQVDHPNQRSSSIWVDASTDGAASFGTDVLVTSEGLNRWPVMAVDSVGVIHLVWERRGTDGGLFHASSADGGMSFSPPRQLVDMSTGQPRSPSVIVHDDLLLVSWTTSGMGHVAGWRILG